MTIISIIYMDEIDYLFYGKKITEVLSYLDNDFNVNDSYFKDDVYGLTSFNDLKDLIDIDDLVDYIIDKNDDCNNFEIKNFLEVEND